MKLFNYASILLCGLLLVGCANKTSQQKAVKNPDTKTVIKEHSQSIDRRLERCRCTSDYCRIYQ